VSLTAILNNGLSSIQTNSAALRVTSNNIANVNTPGYARRTVNLAPQLVGGRLAGVQLADIQRTVNNYLDREVLGAGAESARYGAQSLIMEQLNAALGEPGDGHSLGAEIDALYAALGQASLDPASLASRMGVLNQFDTVAQKISDLSATVDAMRVDADQQIDSAIASANTLIKQIFDLNPLIQHAYVTGDTATGLLDERDQLVKQLSDIVGLRSYTQPDGRLFLASADGVQLISDSYAQFEHLPGAGPSFNPITVEMRSPSTGLPIGTKQVFDTHATSGQLRGYLDMRDRVLTGIGAELGSFAQALAFAYNAEHNSNATVPPPETLEGRLTGLLGTDALNFTGAATIAIADASGTLQQRIDVDFDAGTISVNGAPAGATGGTIASFVTALNAALGANGSASFANGKLTLAAAGGNGLVLADDAATPSSRGGIGFSHFFGLNDLFRSAGNSIPATGLSATDAHGLAPGGEFTLLLKGPAGQRVGETTIAVSGTTVGDMVTELNTAFAGKASFTLDANGQLLATPAAAYADYVFEVARDTTMRGATEHSFTSLFNLGIGAAMEQAKSFAVRTEIAADSQRLAFAKPALNSTTVLGSTIVTPGDNRGLLGLQSLQNKPVRFAGAGVLPARDETLSGYAAAFYQAIAFRGNAIDKAQEVHDLRLQVAQEAQSRVEGVNLDEELQNIMMYQQAYNAGARIIRVTQELYDELLRAVGN
jgi:flagellar hook-associated protein 1